jgi:hypothetical protein
VTKRYQPVAPAVARKHIADIIAWLDSDKVLSPEDRAEYEAKLASHRDTQADLPFRSGGDGR